MKAAAVAACVNMIGETEAAISPRKLKMFEDKGINVAKLMVQTESWMSRAELSIKRSEQHSHRLQVAHKYNQKRHRLGSTEFDEQLTEEEIRILEIVCPENQVLEGEECGPDRSAKINYAFQILKGLVVAFTSVFNEECKGGMVGIIDSCLGIYNHI